MSPVRDEQLKEMTCDAFEMKKVEYGRNPTVMEVTRYLAEKQGHDSNINCVKIYRFLLQQKRSKIVERSVF